MNIHIIDIVIECLYRLAYRKAVSRKCDVTVWDDQVALFELAIEKFGSVDVVVCFILACRLGGHSGQGRKG